MNRIDIKKSITDFGQSISLENIATKATSFTIGGVPLVTYGFLAITAILVATMVTSDTDDEKGEKQGNAEKPQVESNETKEPPPREEEREEEPEEENPKEEFSGGSSSRRKRTKRNRKKKPKRKKTRRHRKR